MPRSDDHIGVTLVYIGVRTNIHRSPLSSRRVVYHRCITHVSMVYMHIYTGVP
jgi:hypothetical protein